jgi:hypothetical protein
MELTLQSFDVKYSKYRIMGYILRKSGTIKVDARNADDAMRIAQIHLGDGYRIVRAVESSAAT